MELERIAQANTATYPVPQFANHFNYSLFHSNSKSSFTPTQGFNPFSFSNNDGQLFTPTKYGFEGPYGLADTEDRVVVCNDEGVFDGESKFITRGRPGSRLMSFFDWNSSHVVGVRPLKRQVTENSGWFPEHLKRQV